MLNLLLGKKLFMLKSDKPINNDFPEVAKIESPKELKEKDFLILNPLSVLIL